MPLATFGGVWLGAELVGESGPGTCSLEEEKSLDEDRRASGLLRTGGCGDGEDLGVSFGDPEKVVMNDRTDREKPRVRKRASRSGLEVLTSRANHSGGGRDSLLPWGMATNVRGRDR